MFIESELLYVVIRSQSKDFLRYRYLEYFTLLQLSITHKENRLLNINSFSSKFRIYIELIEQLTFGHNFY